MGGVCCKSEVQNIINPAKANAEDETYKTRGLLVLSKYENKDFIFNIETKERKYLNKTRNFVLKDFAAASIDKKVFIFGGSIKQDGIKVGSDKVEMLDLSSDNSEWQKCNKMPFKAMHMSTAVYKGKIYLISGVNQMEDYETDPEHFLKEIYVFNIVNNMWGKNGEVLVPRCFHKSVAFNGKIYIVGGIDTTLNYTNKVECYDITMNDSTIITTLPKLVSFVGLVELDGMVFVLGGKCDEEFDPNPTQLGRIFLKLDPTSLLWENVIGQMNHSKSSASVCVVGGRIVTIGGLKEKSSVVEIFNYPRRKWESENGYLENDLWTNQQVVAI